MVYVRRADHFKALFHANTIGGYCFSENLLAHQSWRLMIHHLLTMNYLAYYEYALTLQNCQLIIHRIYDFTIFAA